MERLRTVIGDMGLTIKAVGDELHATATVVPAMCLPDSGILRASVLATWADTVLGLLAIQVLAPRVPVTLELDLDLFEDVVGCQEVRMTARVTKAGQAVIVSTIDFLDGAGRRLGFAHSMFMAAPDPERTIPVGDWALKRFASGPQGTLSEPFAVRAGCERLRPGVASMACAPHVLNQSKTLNGGFISLLVEEALLSVGPQVRSIASLKLRYLRAVRTGPGVASAEIFPGHLAEIEVRDSGTDVVSVLATARFFPS